MINYKVAKCTAFFLLTLSNVLFVSICFGSGNSFLNHLIYEPVGTKTTALFTAGVALNVWLRHRSTLKDICEKPSELPTVEALIRLIREESEGHVDPEVEEWILAQRPNHLETRVQVVPSITRHAITGNHRWDDLFPTKFYAFVQIPATKHRKQFPQAEIYKLNISPHIHDIIKKHMAKDPSVNEEIKIVKYIVQHEFGHIAHKHSHTWLKRDLMYLCTKLSALLYLAAGNHSVLTNLAIGIGVTLGVPLLECFFRKQQEKQADDQAKEIDGQRNYHLRTIEAYDQAHSLLTPRGRTLISKKRMRQFFELSDLNHPTPQARLDRLNARFARRKLESRTSGKSYFYPELELC